MFIISYYVWREVCCTVFIYLKLLDTRFTYLIWTVFSVVYSALLMFSDIVLLCITVFLLCTELCMLVMYVLLP
jgi:hypothetical protein